MEHEIGQTAGEVWKLIAERGEVSTLQIRSHLKLSQSLCFLALGWLAREGKSDLVYRDRTYWARPRL